MLDYATSHRFLRLSSEIGLEIGIISHNIDLAVGMAEYIAEKIENRYGNSYFMCIEEKLIDDIWKIYDMNDKELRSYVSFIVRMNDLNQGKDCVEYLMKKRLL